MSRIADFWKNPNRNYDDFFSSKTENDKSEELRLEIMSLTRKLEKKRAALQSEYASMYGPSFTPAEHRVIIHYDGRSNSGYYDVSTGAMVNDTTVEDNIYFIGTKSEAVNYIVGYCYDLGSIVMRKSHITVSAKCDSIKVVPIHDTIIPFVDRVSQKPLQYSYKTMTLKELDLANSPYRYTNSYEEGFKYTKPAEFIQNMYEIDRDDIKMNLLELYRHTDHPCFEIIIKTCPSCLMESAFKTKTEKAVPIYTLLGFDKAVYDEAFEYDKEHEGFLRELYTAKCYLNSEPGTGAYSKLVRADFKRTDAQLLALQYKAWNLKMDMSFYGIGEIDNLLSNMISYYIGGDYNGSDFYKYYPFGKFMNYVCTETVNQGYTYVSYFVRELRDYINMVKNNGGTPTLYSSYLKLTHDIATRNNQIVVTPEQEEVFKKRYEGVKTYNMGEYSVVHPTCTKEIKNEGDKLNHCVASYIKRVIDGSCLIMFLRLSKALEESLVTLEIEGNRIIQARGLSNRNINSTEAEVLKKFCEKNGYDMSL